MPGVEGFMYPNEVSLYWSVLIVLYPYITGLVAGAFILASLARIFRVEAVKPTYRLALLTALAFLMVAPLPLQLHLGHPERSLEMYLTPHRSSAMAMFGFVYLWYLMAVLVVEIWLDFRADIVALSQSTHGLEALDVQSDDPGLRQRQPARPRDRRARRLAGHAHRRPVGVSAPRLCRLHFRVDQGESLVVVAAHARGLHLLRHGFRHRRRHAAVYGDHTLARASSSTCAASTPSRSTSSTSSSSTSASKCSTSIHRIYEADESFRSLDFMVHTRLYFSQIVLQILRRHADSSCPAAVSPR